MLGYKVTYNWRVSLKLNFSIERTHILSIRTITESMKFYSFIGASREYCQSISRVILESIRVSKFANKKAKLTKQLIYLKTVIVLDAIDEAIDGAIEDAT